MSRPPKPSQPAAPAPTGGDFLKRLNTMFPVQGAELAAPKSVLDDGLVAKWIDVSLLHTNPFQPRLAFDAGKMEELVHSIDLTGLNQPIGARAHPGREGHFQIIFGHRRVEAIRQGANAAKPGLPNRAEFLGKVPVFVDEANDVEIFVMALEENDSRHDLSPIERGQAYVKLKEMLSFGGVKLTWPDVEKRTGLTYRHMKRLSDLLTLPPAVQERIQAGEWSEKHGRALLSLADAPTLQAQLQRQMVKEKMSARAADERARKLREAQPTQRDLKLRVEVTKELERIAGEDAKKVAVENRAALEQGRSHLSLVGSAPASSTKDSDETPSSTLFVDDTVPRLQRALFALGAVRKELQGTQFDGRAQLLKMEAELETEIERAINAQEAPLVPL